MNSVLRTMKSLNLLEESKVRWKSSLTLHLYLASIQARHYHTEFFISQSLCTVGCVKDKYGFFFFRYPFFVYFMALKQCHATEFCKI